MDADKLKDFFIFHVEKMILAVVVGVTVLLIWKGLQLPNFMDKYQPEKLTADATRVLGEIDDDHNEAILPERIPTFNILARANARQTPVNHAPYKLPNFWEQKDVDSSIRRTDPMLAARASCAVGVICSMAVRARPNTAYAIAGLEPADEVEQVEKKVIRKRPSRRKRPMMMMGEGDEDDGSSSMMDMMGDYEDGGMMGMDMMGGMNPAAMASGKRKFSPKYDFGYRPGPTRDYRNDQPQIPVPEIAWFIAGTAVLPHKEMYEAYEAAFKNADGYNPRQRDTPAYFNFEVQRADVTDKTVDQLAEADWVPRFDRLFYTKRAALIWSGFAPELVPLDYRDEAITTWIPPVLLEDYSSFALHPLIPMKSKREMEELNVAEPEWIEPKLFDPEDDGGADIALAAPKGSAGRASGLGFSDFGGMGRAGMFGAGIEVDPVDYKIMRFFDFVNPRDPNTPRAKRKYVYRLRVAVNDPNFPAAPNYQPPTRSLDEFAYKRVSALMAKAEADGERDFQRWTNWSEPCEPVSLPNPEQYFAGPVTPAPIKTMTVNNREIKVMTKQPAAKILASQFDFTYKARIPMLMDVTEGSVLSKKKEFNDVVDPITLEVKKIPDAEIVSGTTVIGLDGGYPLTIATGEGMTEPGVMLLFDQNGGLTVTDEVSDQEYYRIYSFADERGE